MRILWGVTFSLGALLCSALFLLLAITRFTSGNWFSYAFAAALGLGALGCFVAARQKFAEGLHRRAAN